MAKNGSIHPTELELEILKILWERGPMRVREVRDALAEVRDLAYTSVMTVMSIMAEKGSVKRTKHKNSYVYRAAVRRDTTNRRMLHDFVNRVFEGSTTAAMLQLLETSDLDETERERIRALVERGQEDAES